MPFLVRSGRSIQRALAPSLLHPRELLLQEGIVLEYWHLEGLLLSVAKGGSCHVWLG